MKINKNDPRLTAYLLNEISNEDRLLVEQALRESSEIKEEVEKLKQSLDVLGKNALIKDDFFELTNQQRQQIFDKISDSQPGLFQRFIRGPWGYAMAGLVTASFALMVFNHSLKEQAVQKSRMTKEEIVANEMQKISEAPVTADQVLYNDAKPSSSQPSQDFTGKETTAIADETASAEADMPLAGAASGNIGAAPAPQSAPATPDAPAPEPQAVLERKKSISGGAAFGEDSQPVEGSTKGKSVNFQKMKKQAFTDTASSARTGFAGPSAEFLLQTEPALPINLHKELHTRVQDCLFNSENSLTSFKMKWDRIKASEIEPATALTSNQRSCLETQVKKILGDKIDMILIKVNTVSK